MFPPALHKFGLAESSRLCSGIKGNCDLSLEIMFSINGFRIPSGDSLVGSAPFVIGRRFPERTLCTAIPTIDFFLACQLTALLVATLSSSDSNAGLLDLSFSTSTILSFCSELVTVVVVSLLSPENSEQDSFFNVIRYEYLALNFKNTQQEVQKSKYGI